MSEPGERVLIVEDDPGVAELQRRRLERAGYRVALAPTAAAARATLASEDVAVVLLDYHLPDAPDGLAFYRELQEAGYAVPVILVTGRTDDQVVTAALRAGVKDYVTKSLAYLDYLPEAVERVLAQLRETRERRRAEEALWESQARLKLAQQAGRIGIFDWDISSNRSVWTEEQEAIYGLAPGTFEGRREFWVKRVHPDDAGWVQDEFARCMRDRQVESECDYRIIRADGAVRWVANRVRINYDPDGRPVRMIGMTLDITDRKRTEEELARANERLEHAMEEMQTQTEELRATTQQLWQAAKLATVGELAASIAHEVNNPLGTVSIRLESVLAHTLAGDPRMPALRVIEQEVDRMARLIGNLLHFSRHDGDRISSVDISDEVQKSVELIEYHLHRRRVATRYEFATDVPPVLADQQKLRQVFLNLFTNAADAMSAGGTLTIRVLRAPIGDRSAVLIEVIDTGEGIEPEQLRRVFDPFYSTKAEGKGTGLGLAICRRIVQEHGGNIGIESRPGHGTTVRMVLPLDPADSPAGQSGMRLQEAQPPGWTASICNTPGL